MQEVFEKISKRLEKEAKWHEKRWNDGTSNYALQEHKAFVKAIEIVSQLAEEYSHRNEWIPCEKELPPQPKENPIFDNRPVELYLVSDELSDYPFRAFWNGKIFTDGFGKVDVIAWQPLPEPYKAESEN